MLKQTVTVGKSLRLRALSHGRAAHVDHSPPARLVRNAGHTPTVASTAFIAPNASVIGDTCIGEHASIWYGATLRGDINRISIGSHTNIQDRAVVHVAKIHQDIPTAVGSHVTVGPRAILHACTVRDHCLIGAGAQVLDGAEVEAFSILTAGAIVTYNKRIPSGQVWSGVPARFVREVTPAERRMIEDQAEAYAALARRHAQTCAAVEEGK